MTNVPWGHGQKNIAQGEEGKEDSVTLEWLSKCRHFSGFVIWGSGLLREAFEEEIWIKCYCLFPHSHYFNVVLSLFEVI